MLISSCDGQRIPGRGANAGFENKRSNKVGNNRDIKNEEEEVNPAGSTKDFVCYYDLKIN